ncbi:MAG TPA: MarR family transcriptional regulator [Acidimicrobiales bacterium]|nr:MarR family transcriptional regulator [Acidimicrobiales bacterium]
MPTTARRPQPSTSEAELAARLRLAVSRLARRLRRESVSDVTASQLSALYTIARLGPLTLGDLSAAEGVRPPTMTRVVASLEQLGLATRTIDSADRRVAHVAVTARGRQLLEASRHRKDAFLAARLRALTAEERAALDRAAELLERLAAPEAD